MPTPPIQITLRRPGDLVVADVFLFEVEFDGGMSVLRRARDAVRPRLVARVATQYVAEETHDDPAGAARSGRFAAQPSFVAADLDDALPCPMRLRTSWRCCPGRCRWWRPH